VKYFETHSIRKLQLGAGGHSVDGWLNTDIEPKANELYLDATSDYPFPSGSFHYVFAEHLIEHLPWEGGLKMLKECHRVLAPGGKIRIVTPNLAKTFQLINVSTDVEVRKVINASRRLYDWPETPVMPAYVFNKTMREWGHQFIYDPATLRKTFELAGFTEIKERRIGEKTDPIFEGVEFRTRSLGEDIWLTNSWGALAFEAVR
jgi:predicted SAM-dependent methyltransferase